MTDPAVMRILLYGALGALLGIAFFSALDWNVMLYVERGAGWKAPLVHTTRLLLTGAIFTLAARQGAMPLLSSLAGFQMIRVAAVNRHRTAIGRNP
jgi:F1-F0 ATPase (N-ATPase) AtpR subunit